MVTKTDRDARAILLLTLNHSPEPVGIGPYSAEMAADWAARGHRVRVVCAKPYYPAWSIDPRYRGDGYRRSTENRVAIVRCPLYVPQRPSGVRRIIHHISFAFAAFWPMISAARRDRPKIVMAIAPGLLAAPVALIAARIAGARSWLHIQDFEVEAALETGLLKRDGLAARLALRFEQAILRRFDICSTISPAMCAKLESKGVAPARVVQFRNWADIDTVRPTTTPSPYRNEWSIRQPHIALYSGNIANKQGIEIIVAAARRLRHRTDLLFLICGEGSYLGTLRALADGLPNIRFEALQPKARLGELLSLATVHLLPQLAGAADLVLPSKLTNMLASGRPVIATASPGTDLAAEIADCGLATLPGDDAAFAAAIESLIDSPELCATLGQAGRRRAEERWAKTAILDQLDRVMQALNLRMLEGSVSNT